MFETKKGAIKKMLKEIDRTFEGAEAIRQKRLFLNHVEEMGIRSDDIDLIKFWDSLSQEINEQERKLQGR